MIAARMGAVLAVMLAASAVPQAASGAPPRRGPARAAPDERAQTYAKAVAAAQAADQAGQLREALWLWRVAEAVAPDRTAGARDAAAAETRLAAAAAAAEAQGDAERRAKRPAAARMAYERALELDPKRAGAREYLRADETGLVLKDVALRSGSSPRTGRKAAAKERTVRKR